MKLTKISLATLVALGAFSSVANATPLEEAIKNVDLSGFARYRYTNTKTTSATGEKETGAGHEFKMVTTFKAALDDNFSGVLSLRYKTTDDSGSVAPEGDVTFTNEPFRVNEFYLGYKRDNTTVTFGKQEIGSYFTDDEAGTGIKVMNTDIKGLTLAAIAFDALEHSDETDSAIPETAFKNNLYGVAAIGSYDPVNFQLWYAMLVDVANVIAADVSFDFDISDDVNLGLQAQYGHADIDNKATDFKDANFYATEASASIFGVDFSLGYVGWKVKDKAKSFSTLEDQGSFISYGEQTFDYTDLKGRGNFWFATAGYGFGDFGIGAEYIKGDIKENADKKTKKEEYVARFSYDYSSKLAFESWYSYSKTTVDSDKDKSNQFRFEAKYSF